MKRTPTRPPEPAGDQKDRDGRAGQDGQDGQQVPNRRQTGRRAAAVVKSASPADTMADCSSMQGEVVAEVAGANGAARTARSAR